MKKALLGGVALVLALVTLLAGCGGTPKPPVGKLFDLDAVATEGITLAQFEALMKPALKTTGILYPAQEVALVAGGWKVVGKEGGFAPGETIPFRVYFFPPDRVGTEYYLVFFEADKLIGKAWFESRFAIIVEQILKGEKLIKQP